jgi:hypothetical protein
MMAIMDENWTQADPEQTQEWIRENNLIYGGLIGIGVVMVQPFLASPPGLSGKICVVAFSVAIPLLAALVLLNMHEAFRRRATDSLVVDIAKMAGQMGAFVGLVAAFWHVAWIAGVGMLVGGIAGVAVYSVGYIRLEPGASNPALSGPTRTESPGAS